MSRQAAEAVYAARAIQVLFPGDSLLKAKTKKITGRTDSISHVEYFDRNVRNIDKEEKTIQMPPHFRALIKV
jgi:hypothetical protein